MADTTLEELNRNDKVFYYFDQLCRIPHGSHNEKAIADYIEKWAHGLGLKTNHDAHNNVIVYKPASKGRDGAGTVMLQAHTDMVCEKAPGVKHDFLKDPIHTQIDGDVFSTGGRTTLGADDCIGVAMMMAALDSPELVHPALEMVFTTAEEDDLSGAASVDASLLKARRLINIDHDVETEINFGSAGGTGLEVLLPASTEPVPSDFKASRVSLTGMRGGHSGENIHDGYGNAIELLARLLKACGDIRIAAVKGGNYRTAIPREASAVITYPAAVSEKVAHTVNDMADRFKKEYADIAPSIMLEDAELPGTAVTEKDTANMVNMAYLSPNGINEMNHFMRGVVESSDNFGELHLEEGRFRLVFEIRATYPSTVAYICGKIKTLAAIFGGTFSEFASYPAWAYKPDSNLRKVSNEVYEKEFGRPAKNIVVHCGLECGFFCEKIPGLEAISIGPDEWGLHSPTESMSVSSVKRMYRYITKLLEALAS